MSEFDKSKNSKVVVAWQKAHQLVLAVNKLTKSFSREAITSLLCRDLAYINHVKPETIMQLLIEPGKLLNNYCAGIRCNLAGINFI